MIRKLPTLYLALFLLTSHAFAEPKQQIIDGVNYHVLTTSPELVKILWKDADGNQLGTFPKAATYLASKKLEPATLMNGGIFDLGNIPSGLLIQHGQELNPINRKDGKGNFYLKPNGVFLISPDKGAAVITTKEYPIADTKVSYAVQSGPILLRSNKIHPVFKVDSKWRLHRNGVGITKEGKIIFVMTDFKSPKFPNLYEFAKLFQTLGCSNALFLDGDLCQMKSGAEITKPSNNVASIIAVLKAQ